MMMICVSRDLFVQIPWQFETDAFVSKCTAKSRDTAEDHQGRQVNLHSSPTYLSISTIISAPRISVSNYQADRFALLRNVMERPRALSSATSSRVDHISSVCQSWDIAPAFLLSLLLLTYPPFSSFSLYFTHEKRELV